MLYSVTFQDTYTAAWKEMPDEVWLQLRSLIPQLPAERKNYHGYEPVLATQEAMRVIADLRLTVRFAEDRSNENLMWVRLQDRISALELRQDDTARQLVTGAGVHVHIPDLALMHIKEVMHLDDACTDDLQSYLTYGWRILAVCPPNAKRRPDYILGRSRRGA